MQLGKAPSQGEFCCTGQVVVKHIYGEVGEPEGGMFAFPCPFTESPEAGQEPTLPLRISDDFCKLSPQAPAGAPPQGPPKTAFFHELPLPGSHYCPPLRSGIISPLLPRLQLITICQGSIHSNPKSHFLDDTWSAQVQISNSHL